MAIKANKTSAHSRPLPAGARFFLQSLAKPSHDEDGPVDLTRSTGRFFRRRFASDYPLTKTELNADARKFSNLGPIHTRSRPHNFRSLHASERTYPNRDPGNDSAYAIGCDQRVGGALPRRYRDGSLVGDETETVIERNAICAGDVPRQRY